MIYSMETRVRYSEVDSEGLLTLEALIDYFQDTATFHGEDNQVPVKALRANSLAWIIGGWQIKLLRRPALDEYVTANTWSYKFKHCMGYRRCELVSKDGELLAEGDSQYVLMNYDTQTPVRIPDWVSDGYTVEDKSLTNDPGSRKITAGETVETFPEVAVSGHMLDTTKHMNNVQFIRLASGYLPEDIKVQAFRAEYKKQVFEGDRLIPKLSRTEDTFIVDLVNPDGELCFRGAWT